LLPRALLLYNVERSALAHARASALNAAKAEHLSQALTVGSSQRQLIKANDICLVFVLSRYFPFTRINKKAGDLIFLPFLFNP
jgi:hypothetical protein